MTIRFGEPIDPARYAGREHDRMALRELTDEVMYEINQLSGYEYVDTYATKQAEDIPTETARVASFADARTPVSRPRRSRGRQVDSRDQSRERSTARRHDAQARGPRSSSLIAGVNDASALQRALTSSGDAHTPSATPARNAAPSAVVSWIAARRTGTPSMSAWNWHSTSITDAPPSTRISAMSSSRWRA